MNLHIVRNPVSHDSRVLKETNSILSSGLVERLEIAGFVESGYSTQEKLIDGRTIWRASLKSRPLPKDLFSQAIKYAEWFTQILKRYRKSTIKIIHCHDLEPLPIAARLKQLTGARLVYDAHELETEIGNSGLRQQLTRQVEKRLIKHVDAMITVSPSIQDWYQFRYPDVPIGLVRNIPEISGHDITPQPLRAQLGVPHDALLFIYLGGLGKGRGIELTLDAFADQRVSHHVLFMGSGSLEPLIKKAKIKCKKIHYIPPVSPAEVLSFATGADAGLCLIEDACLSYRFCLPNKLFESLLAGLPVLVSDLPDQAAVISSHEAGWVVPNESTAIVDFLACITADEARNLRQKLSGRVKDLRWKNEAENLLEVYRKLTRNDFSI